MAFIHAVLAYVLVSGVVLYAQVPRMMRRDGMSGTPADINETESGEDPDFSEHLNKSVRVDRSVPNPSYDWCNNTAEPCKFRIYDKETREVNEEWIYCACRDGLVCTYHGINLSQSFYYFMCKNATRERRESEMAEDIPEDIVVRRVGLMEHDDL
ncbi:uncharacterized protein LOC129227361 [Uloborus diversus]|uniref:uncharacterized protein LOC129227361 n=1 Tax=Uloborus diversus TaxID=327109 RepID=UPI00240A938B|nr:uncharacterized protein LOC129227361 [Uloborus diversus]